MKTNMFILALATAAGSAFAQNSIVTDQPGTFVDISTLGANPLVNNVRADDVSYPITTSVANAVFASNNVRICTNGFIQFGSATGATTFGNATIAAGTNSPVAPATAQALFPFWDDQLFPVDGGGEIYWIEGPAATFGLPASRGNVLIIQWNNAPHYDAGNPIGAATYQVQIFENIVGGVAAQMIYSDISYDDARFDFGVTATVGFASGTTGGSGSANNVLYSFNNAVLADGNILSIIENTAPTQIFATGASTPGSAAPGSDVLLTVTVTPGGNPTSTGLAVQGDLQSIGGSATAAFNDSGVNGDATAGDNIFSLLYTIPVATPGGVYSLPVTVTDAQSRNASATIAGSVFNPNPLNLGTLTTDYFENNTVPPADGLWYRFTLAEAVTVASGEFFDIDTNGSAIDTELALFDDATGVMIATNDDGGVGLDSLLTFGAGGGTAQTDGGSGSTGANGELAAGTYLLCLSQFNSVFADGPTATFPAAGAGGAVVLTITMGAPVPVITWDEATNGNGDAGNTLETVQVVQGTGQLDRITGTFEGTDFDIYQINICDFASFSATTQGSAGNPDTQLFLFDSAGMPVEFNDDAAGIGYSTIDASLVTADGTYLLCVSRYDNDPIDAGGNEFWLDAPFAGVRAPDGPGVGNPLAGSNGANGTAGSYQINLTGACYSGPSGPCSVADVGMAGGEPGQDNLLDNNDFIAFINYFFELNPIADMGMAAGEPGSDSLFDNNDFIAFINHFFEDGAACNG